jgi:hypothetical protein
MAEGLDFSIPSTGKNRKRSPLRWVYGILALLVILSALNIILFFTRPSMLERNNNGITPSASAIKGLALKLEKQEINSQAITAWKEYLSVAGLDVTETAKIWYRIGKLYEAAGDYDNALDAYYRSEGFADPDDIRDEKNQRIQRCLEKAGRFAALRYELNDRVGANPDSVKNNSKEKAGDQVIAEIGTLKITREELDKRIEKVIASRISNLTRYLSPDRINMEKANLLKQYSSDSGRRMFLEQYLIEEMLYRNAREERLAETGEVKDSIMKMERGLLASKVMENAYKNEIKVTETDVRNYYEANKAKYTEKDKDGKEHVPGFDEIKDKVAIDLMSEKERDVQSALIRRLKEKYNVVVHNTVISVGNTTTVPPKKDK